MRRAALAILGTIAGLVGLLSFKTHAATVANPPVAAGTTDPGTAPAAPGASGSPSTGSSTKSATRTVTGDSVDTRWGPVQVKITFAGGKIVTATAVDYPQNNPRDQQINATAIPTLEQESVGRSTADIDMVSGATYTSDGYIQSLQSALDKM